jgi:hypothetical protein
MMEPLVRIRLDSPGRAYRPGEHFAGEYRVEGVQPEDLKSIEISVLWYTEGKGDEDFAVHFFQRLDSDALGTVGLRRVGRFHTILPNSPLSYRGAIVKVQWCVRVRVFLARGRQLVEQTPFRLGDIRMTKAVAT